MRYYDFIVITFDRTNQFLYTFRYFIKIKLCLIEKSILRQCDQYEKLICKHRHCAPLFFILYIFIRGLFIF